MKFIFITLYFVSNLVLAQAPADIPQPTPTEEKNQDVVGTIAPPTPEQNKNVKEAAKKAKKKKKAKHKTNKSKKKNKKVKKIASKKGH